MPWRQPAQRGPREQPVEVQVRHRDDMGREHVVSARALRGCPVEEWPALHEQRPYPGRKSKVRQWWSSTTKMNITCRSLEHAYAAMFLDRDPCIAYLAASSLQLEWRDGEVAGVVEPAFMARTADRQRLLYLHSPAGKVLGDQDVVAARSAADEADWQVRIAHAPAGQLRRNVYLVSRFRQDEYASETAQTALLEAFSSPRPLWEGAGAVDLPPGQGRARSWHLLWTGALTTHWERALTPDSLVWAAGETA